MSVTAHKRDPRALAPPPLPHRPRLELAPPRPRRSAARTVAGYTAGMAIGFALAGLASAPGGLDVVMGQGRLVLVAAAVAVVALMVDTARRRGR